MEYRCVATSVAGFVQQLVSCYLPHGYWFYVSGFIPSGKDPVSIDEKLMAKYGIGVSRTSRARRKAVGIANVHYIRYQRRFLLLATHGFHPFYDDEAESIRDVRRIPIKFEGYSISVAKGGFLKRSGKANLALRDTKWRVRVQIERELYRGLRAYFEDIAVPRSAGQLARELADLPFEPYAPVRQQLLNLVRYINQPRKAANLEPLGFSVLRYRRRIVRPFGTQEMSPTVAGFMYVTLASLAAGVTVSAVRRATIDQLHHVTGIRPPAWKFANLEGKLQGYVTLIENHYRYYQFYSNMFVAAAFSFAAKVASDGQQPSSNPRTTVAILALELVLFAGSRDTLRKYYARTQQLLSSRHP